MSKITTEDCKAWLTKEYPELNEKKWKRLKKYKTDSGVWVRDFSNGDFQVSLQEVSGGLSIFNNENKHSSLKSIGEDYSFVFFKPGDNEEDWIIFIRKEGCEDDEFSDEILDIIHENFEDVEQIESPEFFCEDNKASEIYDKFIALGFNWDESILPFKYTTFNRQEHKPKNIEKPKTSYDLFVYLDIEKRKVLSPDKKDSAKQIISTLPDKDLNIILQLHKMDLGGYNKNSIIIEYVNNELKDRKMNPNKERKFIDYNMSDILRGKLGIK